MTVLATLLLYATARDSGSHPVVELGLVLATTLPMAVRRLWPVAALCLGLAAATASIVVGLNGGEGLVVSSATLYTVATRIPIRHLDPTLPMAVLTGLGVLFVIAGGPVSDVGFDLDRVLLGVVSLGAAWTLGRYVAQRRWHASTTAQRLAHTAVAEERLRISREIHDVVGHSMSLITVQASVARHVASERPDEALAALDVIERTSRTAMSEIRSLLSVLRPGVTEDRGRRITEIPQLIAQAEAAGLDIQLRIAEVAGLSEGLELAVYRIVQQALTNVVDHAPGAAVRVEISESRGRLMVEVENTVASPPADRPGEGGTGIGLVGMRERAAVHGGQVEAGSTDTGYRVRATFPLDHEGPQ